MSRVARTRRRDRRVLGSILAAEPGGPIRCAAESVLVEQAVEAASGRPARRPSFQILAYTGGLLRVGWLRPLVVDLAGLRAGRTTILLDHDPSQIVGQGSASIADGKITVAGEITGDLSAGAPAGQVVSHAKNGFVWAASVGISPERVEPVDGNQQVTVNGRSFSGPIYVVRAGRLGEVSFVGVGADEEATATIAADSGRREPMTFSQWLLAKGLNESRMTAAEYEALRAQYQTEHPAASVSAAAQPPAMPAGQITASAPPVQAQGAQAAAQPGSYQAIDDEIAEGRRREAIQSMTLAAIRSAGSNPAHAQGLRDLMVRAIEARTTVRDYDMELLRAGRPNVPAIHDHCHEPDNAQTLEAAALLAAGHRGDSIIRSCGERAVEAAERRFRGAIGLQEIILAAANSNGYVGRQRITTGNWRDVLGWAIPDTRLRASGLSSIDLSGILGAVANKAMGVVAAEPQWLVPRLCGVANHSNFHAHTVYSLAMNGELKEVAPSGELKHLNLGEEHYTRQVGTRGAVLRLSRTDIVNDDLGAFDRMALALARKSYTTREKAFFVLLMASAAGASHFTALQGNYLTGGTSAFGTIGLGNAIKAFRNVTDAAGDPVMIEPEILLVPPTLEFEARALLMPNNPLLVSGYTGTSAKTMTGSGNPYAGRFGGAPLTSGYLEAASITGYSAAYWYLFADPAKYPCYEIAYLNGMQAPTIEYFGLESDADTLGVAWRVYWDFGVAAAEWRAGNKSAGG